MKKKRDKKYRPKGISINAMDWAIAGVHTLPTADQQAALKPVWDGFTLMRQGKADRSHWNDVCQAINMGEALTELHIGDNLRPDFDRAHAALHQVALRMLAGGSSTCRAMELSAIEEGVEMYALQLTLCTQAELSRALRRVKNLLAGGEVQDVAKTYARINEESS